MILKDTRSRAIKRDYSRKSNMEDDRLCQLTVLACIVINKDENEGCG